MKNILIVLSILLIASCSSEEEIERNRKRDFYLDEDFILVDRSETITYNSNNNGPIKIRKWVIHRVNSPYDSVYVGEIESTVESGDECNCFDNVFNITNELWNGKEIGSILHFDYIRKSRFFKVHKTKVDLVEEDMKNEVPINVPDKTQEPLTDDLEKERKILEIERNIIELQRELEKLKTGY